MHSLLVRNVLYPLHERVLGRPTFRLLRDLEDSQWRSAAELRAMQAAKLARLLQRATAAFPDYRGWLASHRFDTSGEAPFDLLQRLPLVDKRTLRRFAGRDPRGLGFRRFGRAGIRRMTTGGSTGEPLTFLVDPMRSAYDKAARMRTHRWFGVEPGDREAYVWGAPLAEKRQDRLRSLRDFFLNDRLYSAFDLSRESIRRYVRRMRAFNPVCVFGYPSSLVTLCRLAAEQGIKPTLPALKALFVTGEVLDDQQRRTLERFFNVPVANGYGGRDSGFCAHECTHGCMHVTSEHIIMEIVDPQGRPLPSGESGEIVITNLDNLATPFIRYRTGDIGRLLDTPCPCGRGLQVMDVVAGRRTDHLVADDGTLRHALSLIYLLRDIDEIEQFQIHQKRDRSIDLRVVAPSGVRGHTRRRLLDGFRKSLGRSVTTHLCFVDRIDVQRSGKFRHVISDAVP